MIKKFSVTQALKQGFIDAWQCKLTLLKITASTLLILVGINLFATLFVSFLGMLMGKNIFTY